MEPYQYYLIAGFIFLAAELLNFKGQPIVLAGSLFFAAAFAFKFPEMYLAQFVFFLVFIPVISLALKPQGSLITRKGKQNRGQRK